MKDRDIISLVKKGSIASELEYQTALSADRTLRILAKSDPSLKEMRTQLRGLIADYEKANWSNVDAITDDQIAVSDELEKFAERERKFVEKRKKLILSRLKKLKLSQGEFGKLLGHKKSYISELINGIRPISQKDVVLIRLLLNISFDDLIFAAIPLETKKEIEMHVASLENVKLKKNDFELMTA